MRGSDAGVGGGSSISLCDALESLHELLIAPIAHKLRRGRRVMFFPHDNLALVPFGVLHGVDRTEEMQTWSVSQVVDWVGGAQLSAEHTAAVQSAFEAEEVDGSDLVEYYRTEEVLVQEVLSRGPNALCAPDCHSAARAVLALRDAGQYLMDRHTVHVGISMQSMAASLDRAEPTAACTGGREEALVVGYPEEEVVYAVPVVGESAESAHVRQVVGWEDKKAEALPDCIEEARDVAEQLSCATPLLGAAATKIAVLARLASAGMIHLGTHGIVDELLGARLLLHGAASHSAESEQWLRPEDIMQCGSLSAQLAVLSACNSGRGTVSAGEGVIGLARALLACGVPTVVIALWTLPDGITAHLMRDLYSRLATGEVVDVGVSVQGAMQATRDWVKGSDLASACVSGGESAVYWGSFVVLGAGSVRPERGTRYS